MNIDVKIPKYLSYKVDKWWYCGMISSNDKAYMWRIMERSGWLYKGKWKWMENGHFLKGIHEGGLRLIKHFKLLIMYCMIWKNG